MVQASGDAFISNCNCLDCQQQPTKGSPATADTNDLDQPQQPVCNHRRSQITAAASSASLTVSHHRQFADANRLPATAGLPPLTVCCQQRATSSRQLANDDGYQATAGSPPPTGSRLRAMDRQCRWITSNSRFLVCRCSQFATTNAD